MGAKRPFADGFECHSFSQRSSYRRVLHWLLDHCQVRPDSTLVDLGCGSGLLIEEALARYGDAPGLRIVGIDPSGPELDIARKRISDPRVTFIQARAQEAVESLADVDAVFLCNVLHLFPRSERLDLFRSVCQVLRPGGCFAFNTIFYDGAVVAETRWFYMRWMQRTREYLESRGVAVGGPDPESPARQTLSVAEHERMLHEAGFSSPAVEELVFEWSADDWCALSRYSLFIVGSLGQVDLALGEEALTHAVRETYAELALSSVPRRWLHLAAFK